MVKSHKTISIEHPKENRRIAIDLKLAPLVKAIWNLGYSTYCSCQNVENTAFGYIVLAQPNTPKFAKDYSKSLKLLKLLAEETDIWFDLGPSGAVLRFRTDDIQDLADAIGRDF